MTLAEQEHFFSHGCASLAAMTTNVRPLANARLRRMSEIMEGIEMPTAPQKVTLRKAIMKCGIVHTGGLPS